MAGGKYCPKCEGRMEQGFVADSAHGATAIAQWHRGAPQQKWWGLKVDKKEMLPIESWRCNRCGYLEHYAK